MYTVHAVNRTDSGRDIKRVEVSFGDKNDTLSVNVGTPVVANGNSGHDLLSAGSSSGTVTFNGGPGSDTLRGGPKNDIFDGGSGADTMTGGGGTDTVDYHFRTAVLDVTLDGVAN